MKDIYPLLINKKVERIRCIISLVLFSVYGFVYNMFYNLLNDLVGSNYIYYVSRLLFIALLCGAVVYLRFSFLRFYKKNWESLILLGCSNLKCLLLFFLTKYNVLFILMYLSTVAFQMNKINGGISIIVNVLNAMLIYMFALLSCVINCSKKMIYIGFFLSGVLSFLIAKNIISFYFAYTIIVSNVVTQILFSDYILVIVYKFIMALGLVILIIIQIKYKGIDISVGENRTKKMNEVGDFLHRINAKASHIKNYVWIYKDKDFLLWKIFSTILWISICCISTRKVYLFFFSYGIGLVSSFYFKDIYHFERSLFFYYFMSDYSYVQVIRDLSISGFFILGDNILIILIISCFFRPDNLILLLGIIFVFYFMTIFVNSYLLMRYPMRQYYINLLIILIKFNIPILNILFLRKSIKLGKTNWENMNYGQKGCTNT